MVSLPYGVVRSKTRGEPKTSGGGRRRGSRSGLDQRQARWNKAPLLPLAKQSSVSGRTAVQLMFEVLTPPRLTQPPHMPAHGRCHMALSVPLGVVARLPPKPVRPKPCTNATERAAARGPRSSPTTTTPAPRAGAWPDRAARHAPSWRSPLRPCYGLPTSLSSRRPTLTRHRGGSCALGPRP